MRFKEYKHFFFFSSPIGLQMSLLPLEEAKTVTFWPHFLQMFYVSSPDLHYLLSAKDLM